MDGQLEMSFKSGRRACLSDHAGDCACARNLADVDEMDEPSRTGATIPVVTEQELELLRRFYLREQCSDAIRAAMELSETQYRLLKRRAKAKFAAM
jgi:hypothetical protein